MKVALCLMYHFWKKRLVINSSRHKGSSDAFSSAIWSRLQSIFQYCAHMARSLCLQVFELFGYNDDDGDVNADVNHYYAKKDADLTMSLYCVPERDGGIEVSWEVDCIPLRHWKP